MESAWVHAGGAGEPMPYATGPGGCGIGLVGGVPSGAVGDGKGFGSGAGDGGGAG